MDPGARIIQQRGCHLLEDSSQEVWVWTNIGCVGSLWHHQSLAHSRRSLYICYWDLVGRCIYGWEQGGRAGETTPHWEAQLLSGKPPGSRCLPPGSPQPSLNRACHTEERWQTARGCRAWETANPLIPPCWGFQWLFEKWLFEKEVKY